MLAASLALPAQADVDPKVRDAMALCTDGKSHYIGYASEAEGSPLFYGDGILTPAISVLSAVEGLTVATPAFAPYVVPAAVAMSNTTGATSVTCMPVNRPKRGT